MVAKGERVSRFHSGDRVAVEPNIACDNCYNCLNNRQNFCLNWQAAGRHAAGGMAEYVVAPEKVVFDIRALPYDEAAFVEPLSCVVYGIERAEIRLADRVAILDGGPIGLLLLQVARSRGVADITVLERQPARLELAKAYGARKCTGDLGELSDSGYDVVIDATGAPQVMAHTVSLARRRHGAALWRATPWSNADVGRVCHLREGAHAALFLHLAAEFGTRPIALLESGSVRVKDLVSHRLPLESFERGVAMIEQGLDGVRKVLMVP